MGVEENDVSVMIIKAKFTFLDLRETPGQGLATMLGIAMTPRGI